MLQGVLKSVGRLKGLILRSQLIVLLRNKCFNEMAPSSSDDLRRKLRMFRDAYARNQHVEVICVSQLSPNLNDTLINSLQF